MSAADRLSRVRALGYDYSSQPAERHDSCNLCGRDDWVIISHVDRYGYRAATTSCRRCSLTVLNPRMSRQAYAAFYDGVYRPLVSAYHGRQIDAVTIKGEQAEYARYVADMVAPFMAGVHTLLDIGGSTGVVAASLAGAFDMRATVLDPAPDELADAKSQGLEVVTGFVEDWEPGARRFDMVGLFQTLDHLLDVGGTLRKVRSLIAADGLLVADIVDFRAAYLRNHSIEAATKIDHPFSLTQLTMESYLQRAGFSILRTSFSPDHLHVLYLCRPSEPAGDCLPSTAAVERYFDEIRWVQNAPRTSPA